MRILLNFIVLLLIIAGVGAFVGYREYNKAIEQPLNIQSQSTVEIPAGVSPSAMLAQLEQQRIIKNAFWIRLYWRLELKGQKIHTGEYLLKPGMTIKDLIALWLKGEVIHYRLTLVEGRSLKQIREVLAKQPLLVQKTPSMTDAQIMEALGDTGKHPEGLFFPDTYVFMKGDSDLDILRRAHTRLQKVLEEEWQNKADGLPYENAYQALIMASLIEKETGVPYERPEIAGVFVRRLAKNMLLQTDPTVIYGMGDNYKGRITRADLRAPTPYNTYVIAGLPPTPIAMVGREAIHAALHPNQGTSLYFVARGDGSHEFSDTLQQHNNAVKKYQLKRRADYRSSPQPIEAN